MKNYLIMGMLFIATTVSAQFYVSGATGYAFASGKKVLGQEATLGATGLTGATDLKGSYGEGLTMQLRGGYFFTEKIGVELGLGYLHGADQDVQNVKGIVNVKARGRAYGASLSVVYNITESFYAKAGLLTKLGGKTEVITSLTIPKSPPTLPADIKADFTTDFHGKLPLGFMGAVGYKLPIAENLALFAELEYMGINVTRDTSKLVDYSASLGGNPLPSSSSSGISLYKIASANPLFKDKLAPLLLDEAKWGEGSLPSEKAPYSSFGINVGVTYTFSR